MTKHNKKISIIIPVYGVEQYLKRCVDSVRNQTYRNLEIFLVDDGSPDMCPQICDEYAKIDERIIVIHKKNGGLSSARNAALDAATGSFILCVDSDDYIHPQAVEKLYNACITYDTDISIGLHYVEKGEHLLIEDPIIDEVELYNSFEGLYTLISDKKMRNYAWNKLYKSELFEDVRYPEGKSYEDIATTYLLFHKARKICRIPEYLYYYQIRIDSISSSVNEEKWYRNCKDIVWGYKQQFEYLENNNETQLAQISLYHLVRNTYALIDAGYRLGKTKGHSEYIAYLIQHKQAIYSNPLLSSEAKKRLKIYEKLPNVTGIYLKNKERLKKVRVAKQKAKKIFASMQVHHKSENRFALAAGKTTRLIFFELPCFDNLGEHATAFAADIALKKYIEKHPTYQIYTVKTEDALTGTAELKQCIGIHDVIFCHGEGNRKDLSALKNHLYKTFPKQKIIIFTQSSPFSQSNSLTKGIELYDIIFSLDIRHYTDDFKNREGILLYLNSNTETALNTADKKNLQEICENLTSKLLISDLSIGYEITNTERKTALTTKWNQFRKARMIVTDQFHAAAFALITGTPCIAINHHAHIAKETFSNCDYLFLTDSIEHAESQIRHIYTQPLPIAMNLPKDIVKQLEQLF